MTRVSISVSESSFPVSAVQVTVAVPESNVTTASPLFVAVPETQVAAAVMSQSEPSITRYSSSSATFVIVITISSKVCVAAESESAASALENSARFEPPSVNVPVAPVAVSVGSSFI